MKMNARASIIFFLVSLVLIGSAMARPDVDVCVADLERSRVRNMVGPAQIKALCILADRGYLGTNVNDCAKKVGSVGVLGGSLSRADTSYVCDAIRDVVVNYLASH